MDSYESILLVKNEVFVFKIPPMTTNRGHKAADWNLNEPQWTGRMRLVTKDNECVLKLEDKNSGELFAKCPVDKYPGVAIEPVSDSSRYFVLRIQSDNVCGQPVKLGNHFPPLAPYTAPQTRIQRRRHVIGCTKDTAFVGSQNIIATVADDVRLTQPIGYIVYLGRTAYIGVGFSDRSDSFDLNVALQDHFNWLKKSEEIEKEKDVPKPELDLRFKEGETIKINMKITKKDGSDVAGKPKAKGAAGGGLLPPPPGSVKIAPPPAPSVNSSPSHAPPSAKAVESWGEFASATSPAATAAAAAEATTPSNPNWVQF